ncbi:MAG: thioesterase domain-containing protein, partial [bacterium]|nr:thioesterase domain-containing protein [bacterium]
MTEPLHKSQDSFLWTQAFNPNPNGEARLICFPFAGGDAVAFRDWPKHLTPDLEVMGIRLPGRGSRISEAPMRQLREMIPPMTDEVVSFFDRPVFFFGHSLGAILAYEVAQELRRRKETLPQKIIVSASEPPQNSLLPREQMHLWEEDRFLAKVKSMGGVPKEVLAYPELLRFLIPIIQADIQALETYRYQEEEKLPCP